MKAHHDQSSFILVQHVRFSVALPKLSSQAHWCRNASTSMNVHVSAVLQNMLICMACAFCASNAIFPSANVRAIRIHFVFHSDKDGIVFALDNDNDNSSSQLSVHKCLTYPEGPQCRSLGAFPVWRWSTMKFQTREQRGHQKQAEGCMGHRSETPHNVFQASFRRGTRQPPIAVRTMRWLFSFTRPQHAGAEHGRSLVWSRCLKESGLWRRQPVFQCDASGITGL